MTKRRTATATTGSLQPIVTRAFEYSSESEPEGDSVPQHTRSTHVSDRQPASLGKIHEIDLGTSSHHLNAMRTEAALRRANGEAVSAEDSARPIRPRRPRLDRFGRPMKPRPARKRRNSEDLKRDQLVEEVLRETRLDIYDEPPTPGEKTDSNHAEGSGDADERMAEQFRQEFLDAMQSRQQQKRVTQPKMPGDVGQKGPKLGGSRSARAAMRERELKEGAKK